VERLPSAPLGVVTDCHKKFSPPNHKGRQEWKVVEVRKKGTKPQVTILRN